MLYLERRCYAHVFTSSFLAQIPISEPPSFPLLFSSSIGFVFNLFLVVFGGVYDVVLRVEMVRSLLHVFLNLFF